MILRPIRQSDSADVLRILANREVTQYTALSKQQRQALEQMQRHILPGYRRHTHHERIQWALTLCGDDTLIGRCGFEEIHRANGYAELGYWLAQEQWGKGVMSEAVSAVVDYGFRTQGFLRLQAWVMPANTASIRVLEKSGFHYQPLPNITQELLPFTLLKAEYDLLRGAVQHGST